MTLGAGMGGPARSAWGRVALLALALAATPAQPAGAATIHVAAGVTAFAQDGMCSLREAVENANDDARTWDDCPAGSGADSVVLPAGTYDLTDVSRLESTARPILVSSGITISPQNPLTKPVLDGGGQVRHFDVDAAGHLTLVHLSLTNGKGSHGEYDISTRGGAIMNEAGSVHVVDSAIYSNMAEYGGAIWSSGSLTVTNSALVDNAALGGLSSGGAIENTGTALIVDGTFSGNRTFGDGGAISTSGLMTIVGTELLWNSSNPTLGDGGAIRNASTGALTISGAMFRGNVAGGGGALSNAGHGAVTESTFAGNSASVRGGGIANAGALTLTRTTLDENVSAGGSGGGLWNSGDLTLLNSTLSGNESNAADALANSGTLTVTNATIVGGSLLPLPREPAGLAMPEVVISGRDVIEALVGATSEQDTIVVPRSNPSGWDPGTITNRGVAHVTNTVVAGSGAGVNCFGDPFTTGTNNLDDDGSCGASPGFSTVGSAWLHPLGQYGGPTKTHLPHPASPLIEAGDQAACDATLPNVEQRGAPRTKGFSCDVGAVEAHPGELVPRIAEDVRTLHLTQSLESSLLSKLDAAQRAIEAGADSTAARHLRSFESEVAVYRGAEIAVGDADRLTALSVTVRKTLKDGAPPG